MGTQNLSKETALTTAAEKAIGETELPEFEGFTLEKFFERAMVESYDGDVLIFEIERHRAILGDSYTPGAAMAAFETYWPRFEYRIDSKELKALPERRDREVDVNAWQLARKWALDYVFTFELNDTGDCIAHESLTGEKTKVRSEADVQRFAKSLANDVDIMAVAQPALGEALKDDEINAVVERIEKALAEELVSGALAVWQDEGCSK